MKICNEEFKGMSVSISSEIVEFDDKGIGEISSEELYNEIVTFPNFKPVREAVDLSGTDDKQSIPGKDASKEKIEEKVEQPTSKK